MMTAASRLVPAAAKFARQIVPPVIATLIAAGLISAYNRAFSGHLQQPRMSALHKDVDDAPAVTVSTVNKPEAIATYETIAPPPRLWEKDAQQERGKDQAVKAAEAGPLPARTAAPRPERVEPRAEQRRLAVIEPAPIIRAPAPVVVAAPAVVAVPPAASAPAPAVSALPTVQELRQPLLPPPHVQQHYQQPAYQPPPVITAQPVMTVPDRARPIEQAQAEAPNPPQGPLGKIVDTLKPSNLFARAREFGDKIEQAGNDILPSIRQ